MKNLDVSKKILSIILALIMVLQISLPVIAEGLDKFDNINERVIELEEKEEAIPDLEYDGEKELEEDVSGENDIDSEELESKSEANIDDEMGSNEDNEDMDYKPEDINEKSDTVEDDKNIDEYLNIVNTEIKVDNKIINNMDSVLIEDDSEFSVSFNWEIDDEYDLQAGDSYVIPFSEDFISYVNHDILKNIKGELIDTGKNRIVGEYKYDVEKNGLVMIFNSELENEVNREGGIGFYFYFSKEIFKENIIVEISIFETIETSIKIKSEESQNNTGLVKEGRAINSNNETDFIEWNIFINDRLDYLELVELEDKIPTGLELIKDSLEYREVEIGLDGKKKPVEEFRKIENYSLSQNKLLITFGNIDEKAYEIRYKTKVIDYSRDSFKNDVTMRTESRNSDLKDSAIVKIKKVPVLEKSNNGVKFYNNDSKNKYIDWTIKFNLRDDMEEYSLKDEFEITSGAKLKLLEDSFTVVRISDEKEISYEKSNIESDGFKIIFKDIEKGSYKIKYRTNIEFDNPKDNIDGYNKTYQFKNIVYENKENGSKVESETSYHRKDVLFKEHQNYYIDNDGNKIIKWKITINEEEDILRDVIFEDKIGEYHDLILDSININGNKYEGKIDNISSKNLMLKLGDIDKKMILEYETKIMSKNITEPNKYKNNAKISWEILNFGGGESGVEGNENSYRYEKEVEGSFDSEVFNTSVNKDGILDYDKNNITWDIKIVSRKGAFKPFTLKDTFFGSPMILDENSFEVTINDNLVNSDNYSVLPIDNEEGFKFELKETVGQKNKCKNILKIKYKTKIDLKDINHNNGDHKYYKNIVCGTVNMEDGKDKIKSEKTLDIEKKVYFNGNKQGGLDEYKGNIRWFGTLNFKGFNGKFVIEDTLSEGQYFDKDDLDLVLKVEGKELKNEEDYKITVDNNNHFKIEINKEIQAEIDFEYKSKIEGKALSEYKNMIVLKKEDKEIGKCESTVTNIKYEHIISKGKLSDKDYVYQGEEIEWRVEVNKGLSRIKNVTIEDKMSEGLRLIPDSIKIKRINPNGEIEDITNQFIYQDNAEIKDRNTIIHKNDGFTIKFEKNYIITGPYEITYKTLVLKSDGNSPEVNNEISISGSEIENKIIENETITVRSGSFGFGSGNSSNGSITIKKVDFNENIIEKNLELEFFRIFGENERVSIGNLIVENGIAKINLPLGKYSVKEVKSPDGYLLENKYYDFEIKKADTSSLNIKNKEIDKIDLNVQKQWIDMNDQEIKEKLPKLIEVELNINNLEELTENTKNYIQSDEEVNKKLILSDENDWKSSFVGLRKTDENGTIIDYQIKEVSKVPGYEEAKISKDEEEDLFKIKNRYNPELFDLKVNKKWLKSQGEELPDKILFNLRANGKIIKFFELDEESNWSKTFANLPKVDTSGKSIEYVVEEVKVPGYVQDNKNEYIVKENSSNKIFNIGKEVFRSEDRLVLKEGKDVSVEIDFENKYDPELFNIKVEKNWIDRNGNLIEDKLPEELEVTLYENDIEKESIKLTSFENWKGEFKDLPKVDRRGETIKYTVKENNPQGYPVSYSEVVYNVMGEIEKYIKIEENNDKNINVDVKLINKYNPELFNIKVDKTWIDKNGNLIEDDLPNKAEFILYGNDEEIKRIKLDKTMDWTGMFINIPKVDSSGQPIEYKIVEVKVPGYIQSDDVIYSVEDLSEKTIKRFKEKIALLEGEDIIVKAEFKNKYMPQNIDINVEKNWTGIDDNVPEYANLDTPEHIRVDLVGILNDGREISRRSMYISESQDWKGSFLNIPRVYINGETIKYKLEEEEILGYKSSIEININESTVDAVIVDESSSFIEPVINAKITNEFLNKNFDINLEKEWRDYEGRKINNDIPSKIVVDLLANGKAIGEKTIYAGDNWKSKFENLSKYDTKGNKIDYKVVERKVENFSSRINYFINQEEVNFDEIEDLDKVKDINVLITNKLEYNPPVLPDIPVEPNTPVDPDRPIDKDKEEKPKDEDLGEDSDLVAELEKPINPDKPKEDIELKEPNNPSEKVDLNKKIENDKIPSLPKLPKTGEVDSRLYIILGMVFIGLGLFIKKKSK